MYAQEWDVLGGDSIAYTYAPLDAGASVTVPVKGGESTFLLCVKIVNSHSFLWLGIVGFGEVMEIKTMGSGAFTVTLDMETRGAKITNTTNTQQRIEYRKL